MIKEQNIKSFDWVYYIVGLFCGGLTGIVTFGGFIFTVLCAILGLIFAGIYLKAIVRGRVH